MIADGIVTCDSCDAPIQQEPWLLLQPLEGTVSNERFELCSLSCVIALTQSMESKKAG